MLKQGESWNKNDNLNKEIKARNFLDHSLCHDEFSIPNDWLVQYQTRAELIRGTVPWVWDSFHAIKGIICPVHVALRQSIMTSLAKQFMAP